MAHAEKLRQKGLTDTSEELAATLRMASLSYIEGALANPEFNEEHAFLMLKNPALTAPCIERTCDEYAWIKAYKVKVAVVNHPNTPRHLALNLVKFLFWKDLLAVSDNQRLSPPLRRNAEEFLKERVQEMAVGERIALARIAGRAIIKTLRESKEPGIIEALLKNWRTIEEDVIAMVKNNRTPPDILSIIARDYKWRTRYQVRMALLMNEKTPVHDSLKALEDLTKKDLLAIGRNAKLKEIIKVAASRMLRSRK